MTSASLDRDDTGMSQRVAPVAPEDAASLAERLGLAPSLGRLGIFRVLAHHPAVAAGVFAQHGSVRNGSLPVRLRELLIMRIAWIAGSEYEWAQHWDVATGAGIPPDDIAAVRDWRTSDRFGAADRAVLAAVDDTLLLGGISDESWTTCARHLDGVVGLVELVVAIAHWSAFTQLFRSFRLPLEPGARLWPPDGAAPRSWSARQDTRSIDPKES